MATTSGLRGFATMAWHAVGGSKLKDWEYERSPMSTLYIDGKPQVFVLPLKAWRPRAFDGTALCIGSMAPDLPF